MNWYHYVVISFGIYLAGCVAMFVGMAREDARCLAAGEPTAFSTNREPNSMAYGLIVAWPIVLPIGMFAWVTLSGYDWLIRVFTPKPKLTAPKRKVPSPEPDHTPGTSYRDGGSR